MKLGIVGCRDFTDYKKLCFEVDSFLEEISEPCVAIVSGGAKGADSLGREYAEKHKLEIIEHFPEWEKYGKSAGFIRNKLIVDDADAVIAFWDSKSKGTKSTIELTKKANKKLKIIYI
jgi:hypothetical protein